MPFRDHAFNGVMAINSIEWVEDPLKALKEVERVVVPGGHIVIGLLGPTAHPRENAFPRLTGGKAVCNTMMPNGPGLPEASRHGGVCWETDQPAFRRTAAKSLPGTGTCPGYRSLFYG